MDETGTLMDGRKVKPCMVLFQCPECNELIKKDAYLGPPLHMSCPDFVRGKIALAPIMVPLIVD